GAQQRARPAFPAPLAQKFSAAGDVSGSAKAIAIKDLKLALGDTLASGAITVGMGPPLRIDVTAAMTSLELDPWIASATAAKSETKNDAGAGDIQKPGAAPPPAPSGAPAAAGFALPKTITTTLDLSIGAAVYQRDLIRDVKLRAVLDGGKLSIQQASASFPGGTSLSATGTLAGDGGKPAFDGSAAVLSDNLRGMFDWLKIDTSSVPAERLHKFALSGKIKGTPEQFELSGLDLALDTSHMTGGVVVALRDKPALGARFALDRLDLDAYMPPPATAAQPGTPAKSNPAPAAPSGNGAGGGLSVLKSFDANVVGKIGSLTARGMQIQNVAFDGTLQNGVLTARDLSAGDFGGGSAKLSGVLSGLGDKAAVDGAFAVTVKDPARLMTLANRQPPPILTRLGPLGFSGNAKGALDAFSFDTALEIAGGKLTAQGTAGLPDSGARFDIALDAEHADFASLIRVYNPDYRPAAQNLGALSLSLHLRGDTTAAELSDLKGNIGPVAVQGGAHARFDGPRPAIDATLQASEIIADLFLPPNPGAGTVPPSGGKPAAGGGGSPALPPGQHWSKEPFDCTPLKLADAEVKLTGAAISYGKYRVDKPEFVFSLKNGVLDIHDLKGAMFQGAFDLKGQLDAGATPKLSGDVTISKADIHEALFSAGNIDIASGKLDFGMKTAGTGASPFDLVSSLAGNGTMQVTDGVVQGFDLNAISDRLKNLNSAMDFLAAFGTSMSGGQTKFSKLAGTFTIDKGVVRTNDVALQAEAEAGKITGTIDLPAWTIDMRGDFTLTDHPKVPGFGMHVSGPLDSPERKLETKDLEAYLVQRGVGSLLKKVLPGEQTQPGAAPGTAPA
ncbi:MAG: AsmA-like C-terminal region-containing protein, partial [Alphaproteobacteria bacterium]